MWKTLLSAFAVLVLALGGIQAQNCGDTIVLSTSGAYALNQTITTCLQCMTTGPIQWTRDAAGTPALLPGGLPGVSVMGNLLVVSDATAFVDSAGGVPVSIQCDGVNIYRIFLTGFFPPTASISGGGANTVVEGGTITLSCSHENLPGSVSLNWLDPQDSVVGSTQFLPLSNINRGRAGDYVCRLTNMANEMLNSSVSVIVNYPPSISLRPPSPNFASLFGILTLVCEFNSVPVSTITWTHNGTNINGFNGVTITTGNGVTTMTRSSLARDSGGNYRCTAANGVGVAASASVDITIRIPPAPVTNLAVSNVSETFLFLSWMNNFDGFSPITGIRITAQAGVVVFDRILPGDSTLQSFTLSEGLTPFTQYTIDVRAVNAIGPSDPASIMVRTISMPLGAPMMVNLTSLTSTSITAFWQLPSIVSASTDAPNAWFVEFRDAAGTVLETRTVLDPNTLMTRFVNLGKGLNYSVRVAGNNSRGMGTYSELVTGQTLVDAPSMPQNLMFTVLSAFGIQLSWTPPADEGGRPVTSYTVRYRPTAGSLDFAALSIEPAAMPTLRLFNGGTPAPPTPLVNGTEYEIQVVAINEAGEGAIATVMATTQTLDQPQRILLPPERTMITNRTVMISWTNPGGEVTQFLLQYKERRNDWSNTAVVSNMTIPGNITTAQLTGLVPSTSYDVRIRTMNTLGSSEFSFDVDFMTLPPSPPIVEGLNTSPVTVQIQINCTSSISNVVDIRWYRIIDNRRMDLESLSSGRQEGTNLVFGNPQSADSGTYTCVLGFTGVETNHVINFTNDPPPPPIISETVIIVVSVVGGLALIIFLVVIGVACYCTCCGAGNRVPNRKSSSYNVKSKAKTKPGRKVGKGKRGNTWIETSTKFVPSNQSYTRTNDEPSPFDFPKEMTSHSSFNTLEKQNRVNHSSGAEPSYNHYNGSNV